MIKYYGTNISELTAEEIVRIGRLIELKSSEGKVYLNIYIPYKCVYYLLITFTLKNNYA